MEAMRRLPLLFAAGLVALVAAGCSGGNAVSQGDVSGAFGIQGGNGNVVDLAGHHYRVGDVSGTTLSGAHLSLASLRGKVVVVNFWGSWCGPCVAEADGFAQVATDFAKRGVAFVGIDVRDSKAAAVAFVRAHRIRYPSIFDSGETLALQFPHAVPASTPTTIVIGRSGEIVAKVTGPIEYTDLRTLVQHVLNLGST
jgi:thiol-disulfide isomerase/thioredoxin